MTMNDLVANFLTRVRNAIIAGHENVDGIPCSKLIMEIAKVLKEEGFIKDFHTTELGPRKVISVSLIYNKGVNVISSIQRVSKPGRRVYSQANEIPYIREGLGVSILTTSKGVMTDAKARQLNVGGEIICKVW